MKSKKKYSVELWGRGTVFYDSVSVSMEVYRRCKREKIDLECEYAGGDFPEYLAEATEHESLESSEWDNEINGAGLLSGRVELVDAKTRKTLAQYPLKSFIVEELPGESEMPLKKYVPGSPVLYYAEEVTGFFDSFEVELDGEFDPSKLRFGARTLLDGSIECLTATYDGRELEATGADAPGSFGECKWSRLAWLLPPRKKRADQKEDMEKTGNDMVLKS